MAEFQEALRNMVRMCKKVQYDNQIAGFRWCTGCPIEGYCYLDTSIRDATHEEIQAMEAGIMKWAKENPEPVYPTWKEWLVKTNFIKGFIDENGFRRIEYRWEEPIPAEIAEMLGLEPKEEY